MNVGQILLVYRNRNAKVTYDQAQNYYHNQATHYIYSFLAGYPCFITNKHYFVCFWRGVCKLSHGATLESSKTNTRKYVFERPPVHFQNTYIWIFQVAYNLLQHLQNRVEQGTFHRTRYSRFSLKSEQNTFKPLYSRFLNGRHSYSYIHVTVPNNL